MATKAQRENHEIIRRVLADVIIELEWMTSPEGLDRINEKGTNPSGALRQAIIDVLHTAQKHRMDPVEVAYYGLLGFALQNGINSKVFQTLWPATESILHKMKGVGV